MAVLSVLLSSRKQYHVENFPFTRINTSTSTIYMNLMAKFKVNHKQGIHLCKLHLGFYMCPELYNSSFFIYKWNPMIWDQDNFYPVHTNYSEKKGLREKISKLCKMN